MKNFYFELTLPLTPLNTKNAPKSDIFSLNIFLQPLCILSPRTLPFACMSFRNYSIPSTSHLLDPPPIIWLSGVLTNVEVCLIFKTKNFTSFLKKLHFYHVWVNNICQIMSAFIEFWKMKNIKKIQ